MAIIQKEQIHQRRQEIAEIRHADSVYRDIVARENERDDFDKRWFWELLQNAKDSVEEGQTIKVKLEIDDDVVSFSHTGNPFELDDILSLIIQGSSKNNKEGKTGRFGTGFMTTYLLSKEVYITGRLTEDQGCFHFLLNRNASDNEHFYALQQESNKHFDDSINSSTYLEGDFQTKFTYQLDEKGRETAKIGLQCLDELIPITQLFNEQIESVTVIENGIMKTFSKTLLQKHPVDIDEWEVTTLSQGVSKQTLKAYVQKGDRFDASIMTILHYGVETIYPLSENYPRLYYTFPLIGTEELGIPIIINSTQFEPRVERDGIYLKKVSEGQNESINKEILKEAIFLSTQSFADLFKEKCIEGTYELFDFKLAKDLKWIDHDWLIEIKAEILDILSSKNIIHYFNSEEYTSLNEIIIPYTNKENTTGELWELLSHVIELKIPVFTELEKWLQVSENIAVINPDIETIYNLEFIWGLDKTIHLVSRRKSFEELNQLMRSNGYEWLNSFYALIVKIKGYLPLDINICLNQRNKFRQADGMRWDKCNDDTLISISDLIDLNFADDLFERQINFFQIGGVENFTLQDAISELKLELNELDESDFNEFPNQECSAKFLKWLITNKNIDAIKDLKVLTGASKKSDEDFVYSHFSKSEHLLLAPKSYFETEYPLYSNLVRDKDCLNDTYNKYLNEVDYLVLNEHGFIHLSPLVIKKEFATIKLLEHLVSDEADLNILRDSEGQLIHKFEITFSDFAYLTATDGHIYGRNTTQKSSLERLKFLLAEAVDKDKLFTLDRQEIKIEGVDNPIVLKQCLWIYRAKHLNWIKVKIESEGAETKFASETPSSKNLSELLKGDEHLIKTIRGSKQQLLLNRLDIGVSDLIRNTLSSDELRLSWDKAITNMITSDADPELVQEIFNDPNIKKEYEKRLNERKIISRNQLIGKLIEDLFKEYIELLKANGVSINIEREPFGSDYLLTDESSDLVNDQKQREVFKINDWLVELKATGKEYAAMTPLQAKTATEKKENYALIVVPLDGTDPDIEYLKINAKVINSIGFKIDNVFSDFNEFEIKKVDLNSGKDGISVNIEDQNIRFKISSTVWNSEQTSIKTFIESFFKKVN